MAMPRIAGKHLPKPDGYLSPLEAAEVAGVSSTWLLNQLRKPDDPPPFIRRGNRILFPADEFILWIERVYDSYISVKQAAFIAKTSQVWIYRRIRHAGDPPPFILRNGRIRIPRDKFVEWVSRDVIR